MLALIEIMRVVREGDRQLPRELFGKCRSATKQATVGGVTSCIDSLNSRGY